MSSVLTLKKGTWFYYRHEGNVNLAEIVDYARDEDRADLHWFKCIIHFDVANNTLSNLEITFSSRNFEQFQQLDLFEEEEGRRVLNDLIERTHPEETTEESLPSITQVIGRLTRDRPSEAEDTASDNDATERAYQPSSTFQIRNQLSDISSSNFNTPLGSGDMKSILKIYTADPETSWDAIDNSINETGHLMLTYTNNHTRQKIIDQKLDQLTKHHWVTLEINNMYNLNFSEEHTKAIYLGDHRWVMHPSVNNNIEGLMGRTYTTIHDKEIKSFQITEIGVVDNQELHASILRIMGEINPRDIEQLAAMGSKDTYCATSSQRESISKKDIHKNWEKAFVYNYYIGGDLDTRLDLKSFSDVKAIENLAEARRDTEILAALV